MFAAQTPLGAQPDFGPCYDTGDLQVESRIRILFIYLHFIYRWQYIKTHDLKVQLNCTAVQIIRYMHAN